MNSVVSGAVSVIIPSYNRIRFIEEAVRSACLQSYSPLEVVVVDDGSTDGSYELLSKLSDELKFTLLSHADRANKGQSAAINLGLKESKGEFVAVLDSDDKFAPEKIAEQADFLQRNPEFGMVYGIGHAVDEGGKFLFAVPDSSHTENSDPNNLLLDCYMALPGGALIRRSIFRDAGSFEEGFRAGQDHDMALRIMEHAKVAFLPRLAFYYRKHDDAISVKGLEKRWLTGMEILRRAVERYPYRPSTVRKRKAVLHYRLGQTYLCEKKIGRALGHFIKSGCLDPIRAIRVIVGGEKK